MSVFHLLVAIMLVGGTMGASLPCTRLRDMTKEIRDARKTQLRNQWVQHMDMGPEAYFYGSMFTSLEQSCANITDVPSFNSGDQDVSHCNKSHIEQGLTTQDRTYCPWFYQDIINENRYPEVLTEAKCRCLHGAGMGAETECKEVYYNIKVLFRTNEYTEEGFCKYKPGWQRISVGCTTTLAEVQLPGRK